MNKSLQKHVAPTCPHTTYTNSLKFLEINPNGRIPAITDTFTDGKQIRLFESGSIMRESICHVSYPSL